MTTRLMERDRQKVRQTLRDANTDLRLHLPYAVHSAGHFTCIISLNLQNQWKEVNSYGDEFPPPWGKEEVHGDQTSPGAREADVSS